MRIPTLMPLLLTCGLILIWAAAPTTAMAASDPIIFTQAPQGATSIPGETFTIDVAVRNNADAAIMGYSFRVTYNWRVFELLEVEDLDLGGYPPRLSAVERDGDKAWRLVSATGNMQNRDPNPTLCRLTFRRSFTALDPVSIALAPSPTQISLTTIKFQGLRCGFDNSATQSRADRDARPGTPTTPPPRAATARPQPAAPTPRAGAGRPANYYQSQEWYDVIFNQPPRTGPVAPPSTRAAAAVPLPPAGSGPAPPPPPLLGTETGEETILLPPVADMDDPAQWSGGEDFNSLSGDAVAFQALPLTTPSPAAATPGDYPTDKAVVRMTNLQDAGAGADRRVTIDLVVENNQQAPVLSYAFRVSYNGANWTLDSVLDLGLGGLSPTLGEPMTMLNRESRLVSATGPADNVQMDLALCRLVFQPRDGGAAGDLAPRLQDNAQGIALAGTHGQPIAHISLPTPEAWRFDAAVSEAGAAPSVLGHPSAMIFITNNQGDPYRPGEQMSLDVAILYNALAPVRAFNLRVNYHPEAVAALSVESVEDGLAAPVMSDERREGAMAWRTVQALSPDNTMKNFTLFRITFEVLETVPLLHSITLGSGLDAARSLTGSDGGPIPHVFDNSAADPLLPPAPAPQA